ncbi:MAG: hypothetical protein JNJ85_16855, partial [Candidatus Kapabacteria bacterium]|nr:hypothetical protein [Candidatus Kapabacteria bacterium]
MKNSFKDCRKISKSPSICTPLIHIKGSTRWILTLIALLGICSICTSLTTAQVVKPHSVVGSGAATIIQPNVVHRSTIGQSLIGRISATELQHNIGFWYTAAESIRGNGGAVLSLPVMDAHLDDIISVPLVLVSSSALLTGTEQFRASIRFNKTILQPLDATGNVVYQGDDAILTVSGVIGKASGILSTMRFKVCMGNTAQTP